MWQSLFLLAIPRPIGSSPAANWQAIIQLADLPAPYWQQDSSASLGTTLAAPYWQNNMESRVQVARHTGMPSPTGNPTWITLPAGHGNMPAPLLATCRSLLATMPRHYPPPLCHMERHCLQGRAMAPLCLVEQIKPRGMPYPTGSTCRKHFPHPTGNAAAYWHKPTGSPAPYWNNTGVPLPTGDTTSCTWKRPAPYWLHPWTTGTQPARIS